MKLAGKRILVTGASGGIGSHLALELARRGASLALVGRDEARLKTVMTQARMLGATAFARPFDLASGAGHEALVRGAAAALGGLDVLVNNAGVQGFGPLADEDPAALARLIAINVTAPLLLTRAALGQFQLAHGGHIVNVGSTFGAIGYPCFAAYSASKFALRGLSEALRRELRDAGVSVTYVSPRATDTDMNSPAVREMHAATRTRTDTPQAVAQAIVAALEAEAAERQIGWPERLFVRLNALMPRLVDRALAREADVAASCAHCGVDPRFDEKAPTRISAAAQAVR